LLNEGLAAEYTCDIGERYALFETHYASIRPVQLRGRSCQFSRRKLPVGCLQHHHS